MGGVVIVLGVVVALSGANEGETPSPLAYAFVGGFGVVLLARRTMPLFVLALSIIGVFAYYIFDLPQIGVALPVTAALFSAAEAGRTRWSIAGGVFVFAVALFFRIRDDPRPLGDLLGLDSAVNLALIAAAIALGFGLRLHRVSIEQQSQLARLSREQAERAAKQQAQNERERISRELHDSIGHSLSVISLHAGAGGEAVGRDDSAAASSFERIREQSTASLQELRSMVRLLRAGSQGDDDGRHVRTLEDIEAVLDEGRAAGVRVDARIEIASGALAPTIDKAAYRIVQESMTNVIRHSKAENATVSASVADGMLRIRVTDDGVGADSSALGGYGIIGMTERVRLLGGSLTTRTAPGFGFTVEVSMPARLHS